MPDWIVADKTRLRQILLNLLGNVFKFTDNGEVTLRVTTIEVETAPGAEPTTRIRFEIEDTGIGIEPSQAERVFKPFEQVGGIDHRTEGTDSIFPSVDNSCS